MTLLDILQKPAAPVSINLPALLRDWREDTMNFLRHDAPKIVLVLIASYILTRLLRTIARKSAEIHVRRLPPGVSVQQFRTVTSVITSVGVFVIVFIAALGSPLSAWFESWADARQRRHCGTRNRFWSANAGA